MCVGGPVLRKIGKHYVILHSIGWVENSRLPLLPKEVCIPKEKKRKESTEQFLTQTEFQVMEYGTSKGSILFLKRLTELTT